MEAGQPLDEKELETLAIHFAKSVVDSNIATKYTDAAEYIDIEAIVKDFFVLRDNFLTELTIQNEARKPPESKVEVRTIDIL